MKVRDIAYSRSGDKGNTSNVAVFVFDATDWDLLRTRLTVDAVRQKFARLVRGQVSRYELPKLHGLNFVMTEALAGGVSMSLRADPHGKSYASLMLDIDL